MTLFNAARFGAQAISSGDTFTMFAAADTLVAGSLSPVFGVSNPGPLPRGITTFTSVFATAPTAVVKLFGSNTPPTAAGPQNGALLWTSTNTSPDSYTDNVGYAFYWAQLVSQSAGGGLTLVGHAN
jgi:hypothetical protein